MEENIFKVWTLIKSEIEANPKDYSAETVLPKPTAEELQKLPKAWDWASYVWNTYYQNWRGACCAMWTTHSMLIQNVKELINEWMIDTKNIAKKIKSWENPIELLRQDLRTKMWHDIKNQNDSGDYVENALNTAIKKWIEGKDWNGWTYTYFAKNYSYKRFGSTDNDITLLKYYITKYPIIMVISWTNVIWNEMMTGEVKTIIPVSATNWAHCVASTWFDEYWIIFLNSWRANNWKKCIFRISYENVKKMSEEQMINWRYRQLFDKTESIVDLEKLKEDLKLLDVFEADVNQAILTNKKLFDETNSDEYKDHLHEMNEINRGKLNDIMIERKKLVG